MTGTTTIGATPWRQRHGATLIVVGAFLLAVIVSIMLGNGEGRSARYDPDNAGPDGARALARVLDDEGVDVSVARSADELDDTAIGADTLVVVTSTDDLGENTVDRLLAHVGGSHLVLVDPGPDVVDAVGVSAQAAQVFPDKGLAAGCADQTFEGLTLEVDSALVYDGGLGCFEDEAGSVLQEQDGVTIFGGGEAMTNDQILRGDNAAVSLRLLGQGDNLVWYVPRFEDVGADEGLGVSSLLPRWIDPGLWMVAIAAIFLIVWRARRLGPLSTEPLPVVVKAIETTHSRGRLYRKAKDRSHAAAALRSAARDRAARRLGLGVGNDQDALVRDLAHQVGRPAAEVAALISPDADTPASDRDLIKLARELTELDREVRKT
ncbi:MAG: DUF4350 domain-containing protein [Actinomycetota bacterium]|nr:DUF4350 domain-containing protein [Actinomycetota bacterium]